MKTKTIPFDLETAKKIQAGEIKGRIRTKEGDMDVRIISFDKVKLIHGDGATERQLVSLTYNPNAREDVLYVHNDNGEVQSPFSWDRGYDIELEVPDNEPQFKPFDKVLVRDRDDLKWRAEIFSHIYKEFYMCIGGAWKQCISYKGNEHLLGTTDKPKED